MREKGSGTRSAFEAHLTSLDIDPQALSVVLEMPSNEAAIAAVEAGLSATVLSIRATEFHSLAGALHVANFAYWISKAPLSHVRCFAVVRSFANG